MKQEACPIRREILCNKRKVVDANENEEDNAREIKN